MTRHTMRVTVNQNYQYGHREQDHSDLIDEDGINWRYSGVHGDPSATHWDELEYESGVDFEFAIYGESNFGAHLRKLQFDENKMKAYEDISVDSKFISSKKLIEDYEEEIGKNRLEGSDFCFSIYQHEAFVKVLEKQGWILNLMVKPETFLSFTELFFVKDYDWSAEEDLT